MMLHCMYPYKKFRYDPWSVEYLCSDPTSPLANIPLESIFEFSAFQLLSSNEQDELARLLPTVDATTTTTTTNNNTNSESNKTITEAFFSKDQNPIFWNALDDWQTMLAHGELGTFETYWGELNDRDKMHNVAGDSKNITLKDMCRKGLIRERDVIVYKRNFSACKVVVSKSMTVVKADGATGISIELDNEIFEDFETPTALETKILDQHGKVSKDKRPNGNAFKSIRLLRGGKDLGRLFDIRKDGFGEN
ncbi:hypothetical protein BDB00DRAFT_882607 [Zychaea mexicana]|uniref:uncharacterized protein n=1 Tax=Zychaea mexicana TaxID=64656 RepID=UPI0022FE7F2F|nr:uncharacterized protein BDB00DRAFT_882607 [Zychaea mexicana]KAI9494884.1 hypothetical protein BDB00DRAFT_882607 [Zychaea mexicana]